jgi:hypothetical protein
MFRTATHLERSSSPSAPAAAVQCSSSNGSPRRSYCSALHHPSTGVPHERSATAANHPHASACLPQLRLSAEPAASTQRSLRQSQPPGRRVPPPLVTALQASSLPSTPASSSGSIEIPYLPLPERRLPSNRCIRSVHTIQPNTGFHSDASDTALRLISTNRRLKNLANEMKQTRSTPRLSHFFITQPQKSD